MLFKWQEELVAIILDTKQHIYNQPLTPVCTNKAAARWLKHSHKYDPLPSKLSFHLLRPLKGKSITSCYYNSDSSNQNTSIFQK